MVQMLLKLGLVEAATSLIAGLFKSTLVGYAAGGAVQAVTMAYLTHVSGQTFAEYFAPRPVVGRRRHAGRPDPPVRPEQPRRVPPGVRQAGRRPGLRSVLPRGRSSPPARIPEESRRWRLFPERRRDDRGRGPALRDRRDTCVDVLESCLARIDEWEPRSTPGWSSTARGRWSRPGASTTSWPRARPRAAARDPDRHQGHHRRRRAADGRAARLRASWSRPQDAGARRPAPRGRRGDPGQDRHDPVRLDRPAAHAQSLGPRPDARRARRAARRRPSPAGCAWGRSGRRPAARSPGRRRSAASPAASRRSAR